MLLWAVDQLTAISRHLVFRRRQGTSLLDPDTSLRVLDTIRQGPGVSLLGLPLLALCKRGILRVKVAWVSRMQSMQEVFRRTLYLLPGRVRVPAVAISRG